MKQSLNREDVELAGSAAEKSVLRVGVWLPLPPGTRLRGEGLTRMLSLIATGFGKRNAKFVIVTPPWMRSEFLNELNDMSDMEREQYELFVPTSFFGALYALFYSVVASRGSLERRIEKMKIAGGVSIKQRFIIILRLMARNLGASVIVSALVAGVLAILAAYMSVTVLFALLISPLVLLIIGSMYMFTKKLPVFRRMKSSIGAIVRTFKAPISVFRNIIKYTGNWWTHVMDGDLRFQAGKASRLAKVDCWFTLHIAADSFRYLKGPKVTLFADFVFFDCPAVGNHEWLRRAKVKTHRVVKCSDAIVTLSPHVRDNELIRYFPASKKAKLSLIDHAPIDISGDLPIGISDTLSPKSGQTLKAAGDAVRHHVRSNLRKEVLRRKFGMSSYSAYYEHCFRYLDGYPFEDAVFIFASTQIRPYKNILGLVKAVEILIRQRGMPIKLVISGVMQETDDVYKYIVERGLYYDVVSVPRLSRTAHASMYHCASLTVHPTFFEGGQGAFPLGESLSVGTPVLLSRHPGTLADADSDAYHEMLFDPYSVDEMADRISSALSSLDHLYAEQAKIFAERKAWRSWDDVSGEYLDVFRDVVRSRKGA